MDSSQPALNPEVQTFQIAYDDPISTQVNPMFQGEGTLRVDPSERTFTFKGQPRSQFAREEAVQVFSARQMRHAVRKGTRLAFLLDLGGAATGSPPFVFYCPTEAEASRIQSFLPKSEVVHDEEHRKFATDLAALPAGAHWWTSVTGIIILLNVASFIVMAGVFDAGWIQAASSEPYVRFAGNNGAATTSGEWWRLLTSMFAHYGVIHLLMNMWALLNVGQLMERLAGRSLFALIYLTSGICGGLASIWWNGDKVWSAGASGAVFGILGATLGYILRQKHTLPASVFQPMLKSSLLFIGYNLLYGFAKSGIDNADHIGGFTAGIVLGWLTALPLEREKRDLLLRPRFVLGVVVSLVLIAIGVAAAPRFDYSVREELSLEKTLEPVTTREPALLRNATTSVQAYQQHGDAGDALIRLLENELIPFYDDLSRNLGALPLTAGSKTDSRRQVLKRFADARAAAERQLLSDVKAGKTDLSAFTQLESKAEVILREIQP